MRPVTYEPDKYWSAIQAATLLALVVIPLVLTISLRKVVINTPVTVALVTAPPPPPTPVPAPNTEAVREQIEATRRNLEQAALARQRIEKVEAQAAAERQRVEEQERQHREEERLQREELERQQQAEEKKRSEEQERQRREEEEQRQRELEEQRQLEAQAADQRQLEVDARLKAAQDERIMARYITAIHDRVKRHMTNPEGVSSDIQVEINVPLQPDGRLAGTPKIISPSGHVQFDEQAVRAILRAAEGGFDLPPDKELRDRFDELLLIISPKDGQ